MPKIEPSDDRELAIVAAAWEQVERELADLNIAVEGVGLARSILTPSDLDAFQEMQRLVLAARQVMVRRERADQSRG